MNRSKRKFLRFLLALSTLFCDASYQSRCIESNKSVSENSHVPLSGTKNTCDLGGYHAIFKKMTKCRKIFRSDNFKSFTNTDIEMLPDIILDIDLRNSGEIQKCPDAISNVFGVTYKNIPISYFADMRSNGDIEKLKSGSMKWYEVYINTINNESSRKDIKKIFDLIASHISTGSVVIHCSHGKDRTGIISALILGICGVSDNDIVNNYSVSQELLHPEVKDYSKLPNIDSTDKNNMIEFIRYINKFGGFENFLTQECKIDKNTLETIKGSFLI